MQNGDNKRVKKETDHSNLSCAENVWCIMKFKKRQRASCVSNTYQRSFCFLYILLIFCTCQYISTKGSINSKLLPCISDFHSLVGLFCWSCISNTAWINYDRAPYLYSRCTLKGTWQSWGSTGCWPPGDKSTNQLSLASSFMPMMQSFMPLLRHSGGSRDPHCIPARSPPVAGTPSFCSECK